MNDQLPQTPPLSPTGEVSPPQAQKTTPPPIKLADLRVNPDNPRLIKDDKFKKLVASIKDFPKMMALRPIVVDDTMTILGGNMRYKALQEARYTKIDDSWVKIAKELTPEEKKRFVIEDNMPFGEWDWDILANNFEVGDLLDWGFNENELKIEQDIEEDEAPEVSDEPAISKLGEVYQLGRHKLFCGDSLDKDNVNKLIGGDKVSLIFTDPPYGMDLDTDYSGMVGIAQGNKYEKVIGDNKPFDIRWFDYLDCKEQFWWGGDYYVETLPKFGKDGSWFVWDKTGGGVSPNSTYDKMFGSNFELCWSKQKHKRNVIGYVWKGFFGLSQEDTKNRIHPTQKPTKVCGWFINQFAKENDIVLDLFGGSGSTLMACEQTNRICYMMELDPKYVDVIRKRYAKFIGKEAEWETI